MDAQGSRQHGPAAPGARTKALLDETDEAGPARIRGRHRDQPRRLVHRDQRVVFEEDARLVQGRGALDVPAYELWADDELERRATFDETPGRPQGTAADVQATTLCFALAFGFNITLEAGGAVLLPGDLAQRLTVGLILGNRNVGLVWSALGADASPRMALYLAATQLPIYILPRLIETLIGRGKTKVPL